MPWMQTTTWFVEDHCQPKTIYIYIIHVPLPSSTEAITTTKVSNPSNPPQPKPVFYRWSEITTFWDAVHDCAASLGGGVEGRAGRRPSAGVGCRAGGPMR